MAYRKQLKDKNSNVIYPDVGVIGTNNIADGAITSDKIDWATINYGSTTEDVVVGVYNRKPVYRHVEEFAISSSGWTPTTLARPISNFGKLINVFGSAHQTGSGVDNWKDVGVTVGWNGTFTMNGGTITGNEKYKYDGAGVCGARLVRARRVGLRGALHGCEVAMSKGKRKMGSRKHGDLRVVRVRTDAGQAVLAQRRASTHGRARGNP